MLILKLSKVNYPIFHISFRLYKEKVWHPRNPAGKKGDMDGKYEEPDLPRISFSPTIEKCFQAIYPNVAKFFEDMNYPHMDFYVYTPKDKDGCLFVPPNELTRLRLVHDAHVTDEHISLDPVEMVPKFKCRIMNTNKNPMVWYHPFNDPNEPKRFLAPGKVKVRIL